MHVGQIGLTPTDLSVHELDTEAFFINIERKIRE